MIRTNKNINNLLKSARNKSKITQSELSKLLKHKNPQYVSNWERNKCGPPMDDLKTIVQILHIDEKLFFKSYMDDRYKEYLSLKIDNK